MTNGQWSLTHLAIGLFNLGVSLLPTFEGLGIFLSLTNVVLAGLNFFFAGLYGIRMVRDHSQPD